MQSDRLRLKPFQQCDVAREGCWMSLVTPGFCGAYLLQRRHGAAQARPGGRRQVSSRR